MYDTLTGLYSFIWLSLNIYLVMLEVVVRQIKLDINENELRIICRNWLCWEGCGFNLFYSNLNYLPF